MRFVETPVFTAALRKHLDDEQYRQLQIALMLRPEQGPIIRASGGLRKVRWAKPGCRKAWWVTGDLLLGAAGASLLHAVRLLQDGGDLTPAQTRVLGSLVREEFK